MYMGDTTDSSGSSFFDNLNLNSILNDAVKVYSTVESAKAAASIAKSQAQSQALVPQPNITSLSNPNYSALFNGQPPVLPSSTPSWLIPAALIGGIGLVLLLVLKD